MSAKSQLTLNDVCSFVSEKVRVVDAINSIYVSTDSMEANLGDVSSSKLPTSGSVNRFESEDVLFANIRPYFRKVHFSRVNGSCSADVLVVRAKKETVLPRFLYYLLADQRFIDYTMQTSKGAKMPRGDKAAMMAYGISLPSLEFQESTVGLLGSLDDHIESLKTQNTTLEALAQTLFRSWFVNFDPVHAKAAGQTPEGMSPELAAMFPSEFVESELGMIPKGWSSPYMSDGFDFKEGPGIRNWQYTNSDEGTKFINIRCIQSGDLHLDTANRISDAEAFGKYNHFLLKEKDVVLSTSGTLGRTGLVRERHLPLCLNTSVIRFRQAELPMPFIKCFLESELFINELNSLASGSVQKNFGPSHVKQIRYIKPTQSVLEGFAHVVNPLFDKLICNRDLSDTLVQLRDELLPRLISGKLRIEEAEEAVSEVLGSTAKEEKAA